MIISVSGCSWQLRYHIFRYMMVTDMWHDRTSLVKGFFSFPLVDVFFALFLDFEDARLLSTELRLLISESVRIR